MDEDKKTPERTEEDRRADALYQALDWARKSDGKVPAPENVLFAAKLFYNFVKTGE